MKRFLSLFLAFAMFVCVIPASGASFSNTDSENYSIHTAYEYPITPSNEEWLQMESHLERVGVCQIPADILGAMSTDALVETIANYPLLVDVLLFDRAEDAYQTILGGFNGFQELEKRPDALAALTDFIENNEEIQDDFIRKAALEVIALAGDFVSSDISTQSVKCPAYSDAYVVYPELLNSSSELLSNAAMPLSDWPKTPSGNDVKDYYVYYDRTPELSQVDKNAIEEEVIAVYGLYPSRDATRKYNCHSYAWHDQSTSNLWWIDNPNDYISDPLVTRVYSPRAGDRITYQVTSTGKYEHSGIVESVAANGTILIKSKWGAWGLYIHSIDNCPAIYGRYTTYWRIG